MARERETHGDFVVVPNEDFACAPRRLGITRSWEDACSPRKAGRVTDEAFALCEGASAPESLHAPCSSSGPFLATRFPSRARTTREAKGQASHVNAASPVAKSKAPGACLTGGGGGPRRRRGGAWPGLQRRAEARRGAKASRNQQTPTDADASPHEKDLIPARAEQRVRWRSVHAMQCNARAENPRRTDADKEQDVRFCSRRCSDVVEGGYCCCAAR